MGIVRIQLGWVQVLRNWCLVAEGATSRGVQAPIAREAMLFGISDVSASVSWGRLCFGVSGSDVHRGDLSVLASNVDGGLEN